MASALWRGNWQTRARIVTGLILFIYAFFHFINIGMGLISTDLMGGMEEVMRGIIRNPVGSGILYTALILHAGLALAKVAGRRTLRMPISEALQVVLGLIIPLQLIAHLVQTRYAHEIFDVNDEMSYLIILMWPSSAIWKQSGLMLVVWIHGCIGLHFWLRLHPLWQKFSPYLIGAAVLVPAFGLAGVLTEGRRMYDIFIDNDLRPEYMEYFNWPSRETFQALFAATEQGTMVFWSLLGLTAAVYLGRKLLARRRSVRISYVHGPRITSEKGMTLLEMSQANGVPHTALCGGKGRCTTCRVVVEEGIDLLEPPSEAEARSLRAVKAAPNTRLACQIRPTNPATVFRVFRPDGQRNRAHKSQGQERQLAILFLDMRGFTARTTGQLPYDVVFLLNRFFDAIVPSIMQAGGTVDKYLGDGLLAVFETADTPSSARAALKAAAEVGRALEEFNQTLDTEGDPSVRIGIGVHLGNLVLGEIGSAGHAPRTIIGDTVNAASRLEGQTKELGVELLVSEAVLNEAGVDVTSLELQSFELRGVSEPLRALPVKRAVELDDLPNSVSDETTAPR
ncbi:adenylate/guanylate cyclase domain-containing protein [Tropicibacter sp. R16_0]|uniref:adenylate/guanylate cyclase domain-containing protein n=1 Tax=Tropicibacter sp. R16_0 TaxID=2821102 RepID=UPI001ADAB609|nr:adenylate/guanylate cyclase domain-containing protein [Tropicibacter sp. R16_0]MBO9449063.1 adenylate/guanylate cyclase domain-containing protein [Tropicibacter sp. R16_0]